MGRPPPTAPRQAFSIREFRACVPGMAGITAGMLLVASTVTRRTVLGIAGAALFGLIMMALLTNGGAPESKPTAETSVNGTPSVSTAGLRDIAVTNIVPPDDAYDPVLAGEPLPAGYRQLLRRDAILPVYNPTFRSAGDTDWSADTLVIGLVIDDDARAYPVRFLNRREMVIDRVANIPVLVSW